MELALASAIQNFGESHPHVVGRQSTLGHVYSAMKNHSKAKELFAQALGTLQKKWGENHESVATAQENYGGACLFLEEFEEGGQALAKSYKIRLAAFGANHPKTKDSKAFLARFGFKV